MICDSILDDGTKTLFSHSAIHASRFLMAKQQAISRGFLWRSPVSASIVSGRQCADIIR